MYVKDSLLASGEPCRCGIAHSDAPVARSFLRTDTDAISGWQHACLFHVPRCAKAIARDGGRPGLGAG